MNMLGNRLKVLRKEKHLNQEQLSNALNHNFGLKTDRVMISKWETGYQTPVMSTIICLAKFFEVSIDYLNGTENLSRHQFRTIPSESITILDGKIRKIPLFESVSAGFGCFANTQVIDYIPLMIDSDDEAQNTICIKVSGNSMYPKIEHGDTIVVHKQSSVDNGCIGVFLIDNEEGVVKKANYIYGEDWLELISLNPEYMPRRFDGPEVERVKTLGLVKKVIKNI